MVNSLQFHIETVIKCKLIATVEKLNQATKKTRVCLSDTQNALHQCTSGQHKGLVVIGRDSMQISSDGSDCVWFRQISRPLIPVPGGVCVSATGSVCRCDHRRSHNSTNISTNRRRELLLTSFTFTTLMPHTYSDESFPLTETQSITEQCTSSSSSVFSADSAPLYHLLYLITFLLLCK